MNLPSLSIKNAQFTLTITILMVLVGLVSYTNMPRSEDPQFDLPITLIDVIYPGASPLDIETLVVSPIENEVSEIENIKKIESQVRNGGTRITIEFNYGTDADAVFNKVKQAVSTVEPNLPEGVQKILVLKATPISVAVMQLALWSEPANYKLMEFHAKQLEKRIEAISMVRQADVWGYPEQIVAVDLNLALLRHYGLSIQDVTSVLSGRAVNITPGFVDANTRRFNVKASGNFKAISELADTVIHSDSLFTLRLKDIANVEFSSRDPSYLAFYKEKPVIFLTVQQQIHTNIFQLTERVEQEINSFKNNLPANIHLDTVFKQSDSVEKRVDGFFSNLWQGLIVVGIMSLLFLGVREALVVMLAIPLSFLTAIGWLDFAGFGLQQMSIVGLIIALGLLVDNAIVVTESIHREKSKSVNLLEAASAGTSKVGWAITSGTITTMLAFLPMLMIQSSTGDFVRSMPVTVLLVLLASLIVALTVTPLLASKFLTPKKSNIKTFQHVANHFAEHVYVKWLKALIHIKFVVLAIAILTLVGMFSLFGQVGVSLFPRAEKPMLLIDVETPVNSSLNYTQDVMMKLSKRLNKYDHIEKIALNVGNSNPRIYYNEIPKRGVVKYGQILLVLKSYNKETVTTLVENLRDEFHHWKYAKITVKEFIQGPVTDQPITIRLMSDSLDDLARVSNDLVNKMNSIDGIININNPIGEANTELSFVINYEKAGLNNIDINVLDKTLQSVLSGTSVGRFSESNGENYPIVVRTKNPDIDRLEEVHIKNKQGVMVPLDQIVDKILVKGQSNFSHYQKLRMSMVSADVTRSKPVNIATQELVNYLENYNLPVGMHYNLGGEEESRQASFAGLFQVMLITAFGIFAILVLQFRSILQPLIIFSSIPFAMAGAIVGLWIVDLSFSMMAFIGLISLFGIVVNNAIILIDTTNKNLAAGEKKENAILNASSVRFTPILLTTLTTIGGLLPLTILGGGLWQPLGVVIISGLCVSALSSFLLVPLLTDIFTASDSNKVV